MNFALALPFEIQKYTEHVVARTTQRISPMENKEITRYWLEQKCHNEYIVLNHKMNVANTMKKEDER